MEGFPSLGNLGKVLHEYSKVGSADQSNSPTKITDVDQFSLENIFMYLPLEDLLNVADANSYLKLATHTPFERQRRNKQISITMNFDDPQPKLWQTNIRCYDKKIYIDDFKSVLQMIRCFGYMFQDLSVIVYYKNFPHKMYYIMNYLNEYCAESLIKIEINQSRIFSEFKKTFTKVESVRLTETVPFQERRSMKTIFPNLRYLSSTYNYFLPEHFPKLDKLSFGAVYINQAPTVADMLRLNPQIRSFKTTIKELSYLKFIAKYLQSIENLDISISLESILSEEILIRFRNVKSLRVECWDNNKIEFCFLLDQLKELTLYFDFKWSNSFLKFIKNHQSIEKIKFEANVLISPDDLLKTIETLPLLEIIEIFPILDFERNYNHILGFFRILEFPACDGLQKFTFYTHSDFSEDLVELHCGKEWQITAQSHVKWNSFTLKRIERIN